MPIDLTTIPPGEEWQWRVRFAELGFVLGSRGKLTISQETDGGRNLGTIAPHKALPIVRNGMGFIEELRKVSEQYNSLLPPAWSNEDHEALNQILKKMEQSFCVLLESEERLKRLGWKIDQRGKPIRVATGNVGRDFLYEMVWGTYLHLQRMPEYAGEKNTFRIRRKIASELGSYGFSNDELDPKARAGAPIYAALRHRLKRG